jgi:hypothetical protein
MRMVNFNLSSVTDPVSKCISNTVNHNNILPGSGGGTRIGRQLMRFVARPFPAEFFIMNTRDLRKWRRFGS